MAADGKVIIEVLLESDKVEGQLNELKNAFADLGNVGNVFGEMDSLVNTFSSTLHIFFKKYISTFFYIEIKKILLNF